MNEIMDAKVGDLLTEMPIQVWIALTYVVALSTSKLIYKLVEKTSGDNVVAAVSAMMFVMVPPWIIVITAIALLFLIAKLLCQWWEK